MITGKAKKFDFTLHKASQDKKVVLVAIPENSTCLIDLNGG